MKKRVVLLAIAVLVIAGMFSAASAADKISVCGTGDSQELLRILGKAYEASHPGTEIDVPDSIGSGGGVKATAKGQCDLGRIARPIKDKEKKYNLSYSLFALSPVVLAANPSVSGVEGLTTEQVIGIYSGDITSWNELGGPDRKIYVASREPGDSSRGIMEKKVNGFKEIKELAGKIVYTTPELVDTIAQYPDTIGFGPLAMVKGTDLKVLTLDGIAPSNSNVLKGAYKQVSPFGIIWKGELNGLAKDFHAYLFSAEGQKLIRENGAVPAGE